MNDRVEVLERELAFYKELMGNTLEQLNRLYEVEKNHVEIQDLCEKGEHMLRKSQLVEDFDEFNALSDAWNQATPAFQRKFAEILRVNGWKSLIQIPIGERESIFRLFVKNKQVDG